MATFTKYGDKYKKWGENKDFDPSDFEIVDRPDSEQAPQKELDSSKYSMGDFKFDKPDFSEKQTQEETPEQRMERPNKEMADARYKAPEIPERKKPEPKKEDKELYQAPDIKIEKLKNNFVNRLDMTGDEEKAQRKKAFISKVQGGAEKMSPAEMKMMDERKMQASKQIDEAKSNPKSRADLSRLEDSRQLGTEMKWDESRQARRKNFMYKMKK